ncbi:hypothetical protein ACJZ2D_016006 [Fusarium nematophilum]
MDRTTREDSEQQHRRRPFIELPMLATPTQSACSKFPSFPIHGPHGMATDVFEELFLVGLGPLRLSSFVVSRRPVHAPTARDGVDVQSNDASWKQNPRHHVLIPFMMGLLLIMRAQRPDIPWSLFILSPIL